MQSQTIAVASFFGMLAGGLPYILEKIFKVKIHLLVDILIAANCLFGIVLGEACRLSYWRDTIQT